MAFSLASPLAKFLNGLEILLSKAQVSPDTCATFLLMVSTRLFVC